MGENGNINISNEILAVIAAAVALNDDIPAVIAAGKDVNKFDVSNWMKISFTILVILILIVGIYPSLFTELIQTAKFG